MHATAQTFTWSVQGRAVAYIQACDLVKMLFHNKASAFAACEFCRTANQKCAARCRICGSVLPERGDEDRKDPVVPSGRDTSLVSEARSLAKALLLVLVPALLLFGGLAGWQLLHSNAWIPTTDPAISIAPPANRAVVSPVPQMGKDVGRGVNVSKAIEVMDLGSLRREE